MQCQTVAGWRSSMMNKINKLSYLGLLPLFIRSNYIIPSENHQLNLGHFYLTPLILLKKF